MSSRVQAVASFVISDFFGSVLRFPLWWYTEGLMSLGAWRVRMLRYRARGYAIGLWVRNFFVPMYGTRDWVGRLISIAMRGVVILARLFALFIEALVSLVLVLLWCFAPILAIVFLLLNFSVGFQAFVQSF
ncbi:hypothetical protein KBD61_03135 [Patescibacteria group bacterium]|nr:hypothetical protein [Patescibacteria group bacterium]MBP9709993.1 hypothetical protein [Patescibacteria group bacterium]